MIATIVAMAVLSAPVQPQMNYFLAECQTLPSTANHTAMVAVNNKGHRASYQMRISNTRVMAETHYLGNYNPPWSFWTARGPQELRDAYVAEGCTIIEYTDIPTMTPVARKDWIMDRSTCYGSATWRGRAYTVWPCKWSTERSGEGSVSSLDGVGPGVETGTSGSDAAGFSPSP